MCNRVFVFYIIVLVTTCLLIQLVFTSEVIPILLNKPTSGYTSLRMRSLNKKRRAGASRLRMRVRRTVRMRGAAGPDLAAHFSRRDFFLGGSLTF